MEQEMINKIARVTDSSRMRDWDKKREDGMEYNFHHHALKLGGYDDIDSNSGEFWDEQIVPAVKKLMAEEYPNVKYQLDDSEKGYWEICIYPKEVKNAKLV